MARDVELVVSKKSHADSVNIGYFQNYSLTEAFSDVMVKAIKITNRIINHICD